MGIKGTYTEKINKIFNKILFNTLLAVCIINTSIVTLLVLFGSNNASRSSLLSVLFNAAIVFLINIGLFILAVYMIKRICKKTIDKWFSPIYSISQKVTKMAEGDLSVQFDEETITNEISTLTNSLNNTITQLHAYIDDIRHVVSNVANGNLTVHQHVSYKGDFISIQNSLTNIQDTLSLTLSDILKNTQSVSDFSIQVQQSTEQVAEGATSQSIAVSDLRDNIHIISKKLHEVEQNAIEATNLSNAANQHLFTGEQKMQQLTDAMENINRTSDQIGSIITTINELAEETNLLSLNASIEAARAGEAGRGFAVVADEISKLANASARASANIGMLIQSSKEAVKQGKNIADETALALKTGVENFLISEEKLLEITDSVKEQTIVITGISENAEQISTIIETTAAASEETAAVSEEMIERSHILMNSVRQFKLNQSDMD